MTTSLKVGIFGAEQWTNDMRHEMEGRLDMHAVDIYGLSEVVGPGVACECVEPDSVERSVGKMKRIVDNRTPR